VKGLGTQLTSEITNEIGIVRFRHGINFNQLINSPER